MEIKNGMIHRVKYWEIIADKLSKVVGVAAVSQRLILAGEQSAPWQAVRLQQACPRRGLKAINIQGNENRTRTTALARIT